MWQRWGGQALCGVLVAASLIGGSGRVAAAAPQPRVIEVRAREHRFLPREISVQPGEQVKIYLRNLGRERHEWEADGLKAEIRPVEPGKTGEVIFTAPTQPGTYEFACHVEGHHKKGMKGVLIVK